MIEIYEQKLYNPGVLEAVMPDETFQDLSLFCNKQLENKDQNYAMKRASFTDGYASGIEESVRVNPPTLYKNFILEFSKKYAEYFSLKTSGTIPSIASSWLNLQKRYEYRPAHNHDTVVDLSFVTYIKIPFDRKDEDNYPNHFRSKIFRNGKIEFLYNSYDGAQRSKLVDIDKTYQGKTILFSKSLIHIVYPFYTSEEYRISLAGNVTFV